MVDFDALNRATRESKMVVDRFNPSTPGCGTSDFWLNRKNNETYKENNGVYSNYFTYK
jgi:hypothetical protein